jgi:hypothetical protein
LHRFILTTAFTNWTILQKESWAKQLLKLTCCRENRISSSSIATSALTRGVSWSESSLFKIRRTLIDMGLRTATTKKLQWMRELVSDLLDSVSLALKIRHCKDRQKIEHSDQSNRG